MIETIAKMLTLFANGLQEAGHRLSLTEGQFYTDGFAYQYWGYQIYMDPFSSEANMPWIVVFINKAVAPLAMGGGDQMVLVGQLMSQIVDALSAL